METDRQTDREEREGENKVIVTTDKRKRRKEYKTRAGQNNARIYSFKSIIHVNLYQT